MKPSTSGISNFKKWKVVDDISDCKLSEVTVVISEEEQELCKGCKIVRIPRDSKGELIITKGETTKGGRGRARAAAAVTVTNDKKKRDSDTASSRGRDAGKKRKKYISSDSENDDVAKDISDDEDFKADVGSKSHKRGGRSGRVNSDEPAQKKSRAGPLSSKGKAKNKSKEYISDDSDDDQPGRKRSSKKETQNSESSTVETQNSGAINQGDYFIYVHDLNKKDWDVFQATDLGLSLKYTPVATRTGGGYKVTTEHRAFDPWKPAKYLKVTAVPQLGDETVIQINVPSKDEIFEAKRKFKQCEEEEEKEATQKNKQQKENIGLLSGNDIVPQGEGSTASLLSISPSHKKRYGRIDDVAYSSTTFSLTSLNPKLGLGAPTPVSPPKKRQSVRDEANGHEKKSESAMEYEEFIKKELGKSDDYNDAHIVFPEMSKAYLTLLAETLFVKPKEKEECENLKTFNNCMNKAVDNVNKKLKSKLLERNCMMYEQMITEDLSRTKQFACANCLKLTKNVKYVEFSVPDDKQSSYYEVCYLCLGECLTNAERLQSVAHFKTFCQRMIERQKRKSAASGNALTGEDIYGDLADDITLREEFRKGFQKVLDAANDN